MSLEKVICSTPEEFHAEVEKWQHKGAAPIVRGRSLIAYGEVVAELSTKRGGARPGSGRRPTDRNITITVRISKECSEILRKQPNKSKYINDAILAYSSKEE